MFIGNSVVDPYILLECTNALIRRRAIKAEAVSRVKKYLSGQTMQDIGIECGISRQAVQKHFCEIIKRGHEFCQKV
jgi:predicted transcriptional regulator